MSLTKPWQIFVAEDDSEIHIVPYADSEEHYFIPECRCNPRKILGDDGQRIIWIHNSFDGRENFELDHHIHYN
jgi:hypothetical protein